MQRHSVIHASANRPVLLLGGDRELVLLTGMLLAMLAFALMTWWGLLLSVALWLTVIGVLRRMGKADPLLRRVYVRHVRYCDYYPARSGVDAAPPDWMFSETLDA